MGGNSCINTSPLRVGAALQPTRLDQEGSINQCLEATPNVERGNIQYLVHARDLARDAHTYVMMNEHNNNLNNRASSHHQLCRRQKPMIRTEVSDGSIMRGGLIQALVARISWHAAVCSRLRAIRQQQAAAATECNERRPAKIILHKNSTPLSPL